MDSFHDVRELRGNQGREEEEGVILVELISMIVPPELQDLLKVITPKISASTNIHGGSTGFHSTASTDWENKTISRRLSNIWKAPKDLLAGFMFRVALHHEVADGAATIKGSLFLCCLCPSISRTKWYYISRREKMMLFTNIRNKMARWKRKFIFVCDTRTERMNHELAARISKWRVPNMYMNYPQLTPRDVDLKNQLLDYVKAEGLVDLEALVTPEQLTLLGFVDVANLYAEGKMSSILERQHQRAQSLRNCGARRARDDSDAEDDIPLIRRRTSSRAQPVPVVATRSTNMLPVLAHDVAELAPTSTSVSGPRIAYPEGFSYSLEMANRAASVESRADGLSQKVNELKEELEKAQAKRDSGMQAAKDEAVRAEDRAKKAEADRDKALYGLNSLNDRRFVCIARPQGAEWLVGAEMFQDAVAIASTNTTTAIYNEIRGEEMDEQGKSLTPHADATVKLRWELNEGVLVWPPSIVEEGEDTEGLPSFDAWVAEPLEVEAELSSIPPSF
ncbi:hypothetical protein SLEP1_g8797 [Rubroshorea leprosula]|uniref:Uncharacterized protein n=1 Tax=Rubroshorea leprosula TaxID=152421 RepID=A0AAV5I2W5_9ROSI|nr:hypothetical protein SLEP1_g8797 [Rubroshorea leprosula]